MLTTTFSRDRRPLVVALLAALVVLTIAGSARAERPGYYSAPGINPGELKVGSTLTGGKGSLHCDPDCVEAGPNPEYSGVFYQWLSCTKPHGGGKAAPAGGLPDEGGPCENAVIIRPKSKAAGANSYTLQASDAGKYVQMEVIAINYDCSYPRSDGYQECRYSDGHAWTPTAGPIQAIGPPPPPPPPPSVAPTYSALPSITGDAEDMQTLTAVDGTWNGTPTPTFSHQWLRCSKANAGCKPIEGATASTYAVGAADVSTRLTVVVTAANVGGSFSAAAKLTPKVVPAHPRPGHDALNEEELLPRHRLKVQTFAFGPVLRVGTAWTARVTVTDVRGFLIEGVEVAIADDLGDVTSTPVLTNARGLATLRLKTTRFLKPGRVVLTINLSDPDDDLPPASKRVAVTVQS